MFIKNKKITNKLLFVVVILILITLLFLHNLYFEIYGNKSNADSKIRVACVGDSITEGSGYPDDLGIRLGNDYIVKNFGIGKSTVLLDSDRPYMNQTAFHRVQIFLPDIVVIMLGTNDAIPNNYEHIDNFVDDYRKLVGAIKALNSNPKIWLVLPPPIYNDSLGPNGINFMEGVIPRIEQVANEMNLSVINVYAVFIGHPEYFVDGVHLDKQGVKLMVTEIYMSINR